MIRREQGARLRGAKVQRCRGAGDDVFRDFSLFFDQIINSC